MDMNDRALRNCVIGMGGKVNGIPRQDSFRITVATEVMAILCLASDLADLKNVLATFLLHILWREACFCKGFRR